MPICSVCVFLDFITYVIKTQTVHLSHVQFVVSLLLFLVLGSNLGSHAYQARTSPLRHPSTQSPIIFNPWIAIMLCYMLSFKVFTCFLYIDFVGVVFPVSICSLYIMLGLNIFIRAVPCTQPLNFSAPYCQLLLYQTCQPAAHGHRHPRIVRIQPNKTANLLKVYVCLFILGCAILKCQLCR